MMKLKGLKNRANHCPARSVSSITDFTIFFLNIFSPLSSYSLFNTDFFIHPGKTWAILYGDIPPSSSCHS